MRWRGVVVGSLLALAGCSTTTATSTTTTMALLTPSVLGQVDQAIRATGAEELFAFQRVEADGETVVVRTGLAWKQETADVAMGLCGQAAGSLIEAGAERASIRVLASNGDNLALTIGPAGRDGRMAGTCHRTSAFNRRG